jgi:hypothetical protein
MADLFTISWPKRGASITAELLARQDPELIGRFRDSLPRKSIQSHAVVAGFQMYCPFRMSFFPKHPYHEPMNEQPPGRINLELDFQYLAINYGAMTEPVPALPVAQVLKEDIPVLVRMGKQAWENLLFSDEFLLVVFDKKEANLG